MKHTSVGLWSCLCFYVLLPPRKLTIVKKSSPEIVLLLKK